MELEKLEQYIIELIRLLSLTPETGKSTMSGWAAQEVQLATETIRDIFMAANAVTCDADFCEFVSDAELRKTEECQ